MKTSKMKTPTRLAGKTEIVGVTLVAFALALAINVSEAAADKHIGLTVKLRQVLFQTSSTGNPPVSGSNSAVGTSDGHVGRLAVHGAVRGTNVYPAFTGKWVMLDSSGTIRFSLRGRVTAPGSFAGTAKITGGTGRYSRAGGTLAFTAHVQQPTNGQSSPVIVRSVTGTLVIR